MILNLLPYVYTIEKMILSSPHPSDFSVFLMLNMFHLVVAAGFYICWGCLVWVPSIYTSPGMYLVNHPVNLGTQVLSVNFVCFSCIFIVISAIIKNGVVHW